MDELRATITQTCPKCGDKGESLVGQFCTSKLGLAWEQSFLCRRCNSLLSFQGEGVPEVTVRQSLSPSGGCVGWYCDRNDSQLGTALFDLRKPLNLSVGDVAQVKKHAPGLLAIGNQVEMCWLSEVVEQVGLHTLVIPVDFGMSAPLDFLRLALRQRDPVNAALLGLDPLMITDSDFLSHSNFEIHSAGKAPPRRLSPVAAYKAEWRSRRLYDAKSPVDVTFVPDCFLATEAVDYDSPLDATAWLSSRINESAQLIVSMGFEEAYFTDGKTFLRIWDDLMYGSDADVWPIDEAWALVHSHESIWFFARRRDVLPSATFHSGLQN